MITNLRDKLDRLGKQNQNGSPKKKFDISADIGGKVFQTENGGFILKTADYRYGTEYGNYTVVNIEKEHTIAERLLFIDTETTGLGAGAFAFLIGIAYFTDESLRLEQIFMRDLDDEPAALGYLIENFSDMTAVSFNGKTFDIPLLKGRCVINGIAARSFAEKQTDLLHMSRKIWKKRLESCRLGSIEEEILNFERENDIAGSLVPELYKKYLQSGKSEDIADIIRHNENDVVSMSVLFEKLIRIERSPISELDNIIDVFHLGEACFNKKEYCKARECLEAVIHTRTDSFTLYSSMKYLSLIHKKNEEWDKAVYYWDRMDKINLSAVFPLVELAKYYEHKANNVSKAIEVTERALRYSTNMKSKEQISELKMRLKRLYEKTAKGNKNEFIN